MEVEGSPRSIRGSSINIISSPPSPPPDETLTSSLSQITRPHTQSKYTIESSLELPSSLASHVLFRNTPLPLNSSDPHKYADFEEEHNLKPLDEDTMNTDFKELNIDTQYSETQEDVEDTVVATLTAGFSYQRASIFTGFSSCMGCTRK